MNQETPAEALIAELTNNAAPNENPFSAQAALEANKPKEPTWMDAIITGKKVRPFFTVVYGAPGVGKTTFASKADKPIFIPTERGTDQVGPNRFPMPKSFEEFRAMCSAVGKGKHEYKTLVIDTADGLEALIWDEVCRENKVTSIEQLSYGKGYSAAQTKWRNLLNSLVLLSEKKMNVVILAHAHVKAFTDPALPNPYDMWKIKMHEKSADVLRECVDNILFACFDVTVSSNDNKARGLHSGDRILRTTAGTGFEAKSRFDLPDPLPLTWEALANGVREFYEK